MKAAKATIGIPVYNEINYIENTLHSVVQQEVDQIVISDNASTDGSSEICLEYAAKYPHIKYHRFEQTQSVTDNFLNCINLSEHEYFMIMGGHDLLSKNYISKLRQILDTTDSVLAYTNAVHLTDNYAFKLHYDYYFAKYLAHDDAMMRVLATIECLSNCTLYYGLFRKNVFLRAYLECEKSRFNGIDHAVLSQVAAYGRMTLCEEATFFRIDPPRQEPNQEQKWSRVLQAMHASAYDKNIHIPELIPLGIAYTQFNIALAITPATDEGKKFLGKILKILLDRWAVNDNALGLMLKELRPLIKERGINFLY